MTATNLTTGASWTVTGDLDGGCGPDRRHPTRSRKQVTIDGVNSFGRAHPRLVAVAARARSEPGRNVNGPHRYRFAHLVRVAEQLAGRMIDFTLIVADGTTWLGEVDTYESAQIIARYNDIQHLGAGRTHQLGSGRACCRLRPDHDSIVTSAPGVVFRSGPVVRFEREVSTDGDMLTVSGVDDMAWLRRRLAHPQPGTAAPPYSTTAYDTRTGPASQVIAGFVDANAGPSAVAARRVPGLTVPTPAPMGDVVTVSARYQNLFDLIIGIAASAGLGVEVRDLALIVTEPSGPAAVFSQELGTLAGWRHAVESPDVNHVYVAGAGVGEARLIVEYEDSESVMEWGRVENFQDRRDTADTTELDQAGAETLAAGIPAPELELHAVDTESQAFLTDWQLGDQATVSFDGQTITDVIREVTISMDGNTPPLIIPTVGGRP